jgi:hypothetical protein
LCISDQIKDVLKIDDQIHALAKELFQQKSLLVMGRGYNYATCLEGALVSIAFRWSSYDRTRLSGPDKQEISTLILLAFSKFTYISCENNKLLYNGDFCKHNQSQFSL